MWQDVIYFRNTKCLLYWLKLTFQISNHHNQFKNEVKLLEWKWVIVWNDKSVTGVLGVRRRRWRSMGFICWRCPTCTRSHSWSKVARRYWVIGLRWRMWWMCFNLQECATHQISIASAWNWWPTISKLWRIPKAGSSCKIMNLGSSSISYIIITLVCNFFLVKLILILTIFVTI